MQVPVEFFFKRKKEILLIPARYTNQKAMNISWGEIVSFLVCVLYQVTSNFPLSEEDQKSSFKITPDFVMQYIPV